MASIISTETPPELFRELVEAALDHQRLESSDDSTAYLVHLLDSFVRHEDRYAAAGACPGQPLSAVLLGALQDPSPQSLTSLRFVGDLALFFVGFYSPGLRHDIAGPGCYARLGGSAYGALARSRRGGAAQVFQELASNFLRFADILTEVSEHCAVTDASDLLRLYERWQETGSVRSAEQLRAQGIHVGPGSDAVH